MGKFLKIGLTGGIGSGKSLVLKWIGEQGIPVLQTDLVGHEILKNGGIKKKLLASFGKAILGKDGEVDRKALAKEVFRDREKQTILNELMHPAIRRRVGEWIRQQKIRKPAMVVVEVPLLFERGYNRSFDGVLCVSSTDQSRRKRLVKRGWKTSEMKRREKLQWSQRRKNKMADWVIINQGSRKDLKYAVHQWVEKIEGIG